MTTRLVSAPTVHHKPVNEVDNQPTKTTKSAMFGGIPFEAFAGGGMPGGSGMGGMGGPPKDVDTTKLYETLEVEKTADEKDIKKAYRRLSRIHHPDKGGEEHKFKEINAACE